jgi:hypothetical protein
MFISFALFVVVDHGEGEGGASYYRRWGIWRLSLLLSIIVRVRTVQVWIEDWALESFFDGGKGL